MADSKSPISPVQTLPSRATTMSVDEDAVPGEDTSELTKLFQERLQAWKHAVAYLEDYVTATEKIHHSQAKEYEKVLKTVSNPLKEGHHFDQQLGGIAGMFDNIRSNTQGIANSHSETEKALKGSVLPIFERLHNEIKNKAKELTKGAGKGAKAVDKARNTSQKHIELLGQHTASFESTGGKINAADDPYVLRRGVIHRLNKQIIEENNNRQDLIAVQNNFASFESHVVGTIQTGMAQLLQVLNGQAEQNKAMYSDMVTTTHRIQPDFEWNGFIERNNTLLIDPNGPPRNIANVSFPNMDHKATKPLIAGSLERKGKVLKKYDTYYYVVTPSKFLHEFKTDDDLAKEPNPEISLYLPDCVVGAVSGEKFNIKGKDVSKGSVGNKFSMSHELQFKAHTASSAEQWWEIIKSAAGQVTEEIPVSTPNTPIEPAAAPFAAEKHPAPLQTQGIVPAAEVPTSAAAATPATATTTASTVPPASATSTVPASATSTAPTSAATTVPPTSAVAEKPATEKITEHHHVEKTVEKPVV